MVSSALKTSTIKSSSRRSAIAEQPSVLADIYQDEVNIAIWQKPLTETLTKSVNELLKQASNLKLVMTVAPDSVSEHLAEHSAYLANQKELCDHISLLVDMFCTLFELKRVGLRLTRLDHAMCPKFHVDKVPCRLVTTFCGAATEWLPHDKVNRSKLGVGSLGSTDESSGIYQQPSDIQQLSIGDVALLKGEGWYNNENAGIVHRSPSVIANEDRLLLTLDFID